MCVNDVCVIKLIWMENGWMDWIEWMWIWKVESGKWRGSGSHNDITTSYTEDFYDDSTGRYRIKV